MPLESFHSSERRGLDRSVETEQATSTGRPVVPYTHEGATALGRAYWAEVNRVSRRLLRYRETHEGLELTVLGVGPTLLRLGHVEIAVGPEQASCTYAIRGGLLTLGEGGTLRVSQTGAGPTELGVTVAGFLPRGGPIYALQRRLHVAVSRRFFRRLTRGGM